MSQQAFFCQTKGIKKTDFFFFIFYGSFSFTIGRMDTAIIFRTHVYSNACGFNYLYLYLFCAKSMRFYRNLDLHHLVNGTYRNAQEINDYFIKSDKDEERKFAYSHAKSNAMSTIQVNT